MSDNQYDDLFDNDDAIAEAAQSESGPKALRDAYKALKAEKAKAETELNELRSKQRQSEVAQALSAAGLPEAAAKFAKDAEDIDAWIEENRGLFGAAGNSTTVDDGDGAPQGVPSLSADQIAQMQSVVGVQPGSFNPGTLDEQNAQLASAKSRAEFYETLAKQGRLEGQLPV